MTNGRYMLRCCTIGVLGCGTATVGLFFVLLGNPAGWIAATAGIIIMAAATTAILFNIWPTMRSCALHWSRYTDQDKTETRAEMLHELRQLPSNIEPLNRLFVAMFTFTLERLAGRVARDHGWTNQ